MKTYLWVPGTRPNEEYSTPEEQSQVRAGSPSVNQIQIIQLITCSDPNHIPLTIINSYLRTSLVGL